TAGRRRSRRSRAARSPRPSGRNRSAHGTPPTGPPPCRRRDRAPRRVPGGWARRRYGSLRSPLAALSVPSGILVGRLVRRVGQVFGQQDGDRADMLLQQRDGGGIAPLARVQDRPVLLLPPHLVLEDRDMKPEVAVDVVMHLLDHLEQQRAARSRVEGG